MSGTSQKEYLKKYLSGPSKDEKKKKKKHTKIKGQGMKIIDDDVDLSKMRSLDDDELDFMGNNEDAPQVAGIVDERPEEVKRLEQFSREKWKVITEDDGFNSSLTVQQISKKIPDIVRSDKSDSDLSPLRNNELIDSDISVERPKSNIDQIKTLKNGNSKTTKSKKSSDSDLSPNRKNKINSDSDLSPVRDRNKKDIKRSKMKNRNNSDSDLSPPRNKKRLEEPKKRERSRKDNSDSDLSPPRNKRIDSGKDDFYKSRERNRESDLSRRIKQESDSDFSPQRRKNSDHTTIRNKSPVRERNRNQSDLRRVEKDDRRVRHRDNINSDNASNFGNKRDFVESKNKSKNRTDDFKSKDKRRNSSDSDLYLRKEVEVKKVKDRGERKRSRWADPDEELGQQILENISKNKNRSNESSSRTDKDDGRKHGIHASSKRDHREDINRRSRETYNDKHDDKKTFGDRNNARVTDLSNDKGDDNRRNNSRISERTDVNNRSTKKMEKTLDGKKAGLQDARQLKQENQEFKTKEAALFENLSEEFSGRNAKAIKRDLKGKRETEEDKQKQREKEVKDKELEAKYHQWGKGLKQVEEQEANIRDYMHEASKPLARHRDDRDLESALRQKERDGDPMLEYMRRKETEKGTQGNMPVHPIYKGPYPPNRFDIRPGHRWDGVDRSNGHEAAVFQARSSKKALDSEQYKWSTEDM